MTDPSSLPNCPPPGDERPLRGRVLDALQDEGYRPDIDEDGDVAFKVQGQQLFVRCMEGDFDIMRVFGQWQIGEEVPQDLMTQLQTCNDLTLGLNIIKAGIASGTLVMTGEHVVLPETDIKAMLEVTSQLILSGVQMWHQAILGDGTITPPDGGQPGGGQPGGGQPGSPA